MLRLLNALNDAPPACWLEVITPLGASAHVQIHSEAHELCEDWAMLTKGRVQLVNKANFGVWFGPLFAAVPHGLAAELLMANNMLERFAALVAADANARAYILALPKHCWGLGREESERLEQALDIARRFDARDAARAAVLEAAGG